MLTLEAEKDVKGLSLLYEYLLVIAHDYLEIKTTEKVPPIPNFGINNTFNASNSNKDWRHVTYYES